MLIAVGSLVGAPGASSLTRGLAAVWSTPTERRIVIEVDPDGGRLAAELGVSSETGLVSLASATRSSTVNAVDVLRAATSVGEWSVVCAPPSGEETVSTVSYLAARLAVALRADRERVWLVDAGRISTRSPVGPLLQAADEVLLVSGGSAPALLLLPARVAALRAAGVNVSLVVVGDSPWAWAEIAGFAECDLLAVVPSVGCQDGDVMMSARVWRPWWTHVATLAELLADRAEAAVGGVR